MKSLEQLIDEIMKTGQWRSLNIFACKDGTYFASLSTQDYSSHVADQCKDPAAGPAERARMLIEANLKPAQAKPAELFDDLLG